MKRVKVKYLKDTCCRKEGETRMLYDKYAKRLEERGVVKIIK
jgi:hypothetical protein